MKHQRRSPNLSRILLTIDIVSAKFQKDGGEPYVSNAIFKFCKSFVPQNTITAVYHPQRNRKAEWLIQKIKG